MAISAKKAWFNGKQIPFQDAKVHMLCHALHYGTSVFEGVRYYPTPKGCPAVFRLQEHTARLLNSAKILLMKVPYTEEQLIQAQIETVKANGLAEGYIRPLIFSDAGNMGLFAVDNPTSVAIATWEWPAFLGEDATKNGVRAKISTFTRSHVNVNMTKAKIGGQYINSVLSKREAMLQGFDECILLDPQGYVSEASAENLFIVHDGVLKTPPPDSILTGLTRDTLMTIARDNDIKVIEQRFTRDEFYLADEAFLCGTAAEVTPIRELDSRAIGTGKPGPMTQFLQGAYFDVIRGKRPEYEGWLTYIE